MEKILNYLEEHGSIGGIGAFLLIASWGISITDLLDFKFGNVASLPPAQIIASFAAAIGLLLIFYRLKQVSKVESRAKSANDSDRALWERLVSFLTDRRALSALQQYEHLPSMFDSIDGVRTHLRQEIQALPPDSDARPSLECLQSACRDFAIACERIWASPESRPNHLVELTPLVHLQYCTAVGVLRGQITAILKLQDPKIVANAESLIGKLTLVPGG